MDQRKHFWIYEHKLPLKALEVIFTGDGVSSSKYDASRTETGLGCSVVGIPGFLLNSCSLEGTVFCMGDNEVHLACIIDNASFIN